MAETKKTKKQEEMSFEQAMKRISEIAQALESGSATLDEELVLYEEGMTLVRLCNEKLNQAELTIKTLSKSEAENE